MTHSIPLSNLESSPSAKFHDLGDTYTGWITDVAERQQTDIKSGAPLTFSDGTPRMQWVITLEPENGDPVRLYAKGGKYRPATGKGASMLSAIGQAVRAANAEALEIGGELTVAFSGLGESKPGMDAPKLYTATYRQPSAGSIPASDLYAE